MLNLFEKCAIICNSISRKVLLKLLDGIVLIWREKTGELGLKIWKLPNEYNFYIRPDLLAQ